MTSLSLLDAADWLINLFVIAPIYLAYWCGSFELLEQFLNSDVTQTLRNATITTCIGSSFYLAYFIYPIVNHLSVDTHPVTKHILVTVTMLIGAIANMAYWKGLWMFTYWFLEHASWKVSLTTCIGSIGLSVLAGSTSGLIAAPFSCSVDSCPDVMKPTDFFGNEYPGLRAKSLIMYALGSAISIFICDSINIIIWSSAFCLLYTFELYENETLYIMLAISSSITLVMFLLEIPMARLRHFLLLPRNRQLNISTISNNHVSHVTEDSLESFPSHQDDTVAEVKIETSRNEFATNQKVSRFSLNRKKILQMIFDSTLNLIIFIVVLFWYYSAWTLYEQIFFKNRLFGAALSWAASSLLSILLQITSLSGGTANYSDWFKVVDTDGDETQMKNRQLYLYPNLYTRYLKNNFRQAFV